MCRRRLITSILLLTAVLLLPSCARAGDFDAGSPLSSEELGSVSEALFGGTEASAPAVVYWTEDSEIYHLDPDCHYLRRAERVRYSSLPNALRHGKTTACASCGGEAS